MVLIMTKFFPIARETINGKEYLLFDLDTFYLFFNEVVKYKDISQDVIDEVNRRYIKAKKIKKKRIRFKKQKQVAIIMCNILLLDI